MNTYLCLPNAAICGVRDISFKVNCGMISSRVDRWAGVSYWLGCLTKVRVQLIEVEASLRVLEEDFVMGRCKAVLDNVTSVWNRLRKIED
jgi:hypothetical protein